MDKKRLMCPTRKAQVTIFIIVGLVIFFVFMSLIYISGNIRKEKLEEQKEKVLTHLFKKEALRIYVEDCLQDELEQGLLILGKQGRLWKGQFGGTKVFEEGKTGVTLDGTPYGRVAYAITNTTYTQFLSAYPCDTEEHPPEFCKYRFPNTAVGFGEIQLKPEFIKEDLRQYLLNRTMVCVQNFTEKNMSSKAIVTADDPLIGLELLDDGINVKAEYPLRFKLGGEELFHLTTFDFFYPSNFGKFLKAAVTFPVQWDQKYVDYDYTKDQLGLDTFTHGTEKAGYSCVPVPDTDYYECTKQTYANLYNTLGIAMERLVQRNGDTAYIFRPALTQIVQNPIPFEFRMVRQNRPPALNYVNRSECPEAGYDYLVIKDDPEYGGIDINLGARDPDEAENLVYEFKWDDFSVPEREIVGATSTWDKIVTFLQGMVGRASSSTIDYHKVLDTINDDVTIPGSVFHVSKDPPPASGLSPMKDFTPGFYAFNVKVDDGHLEDSQIVRVLVDRPIDAELGVSLETGYRTAQGDSIQNVVSLEDPAFVTITLPEDSVVSDLPVQTMLRYEPISPLGTTYSAEVTKARGGLRLGSASAGTYGSKSCFRFFNGLIDSSCEHDSTIVPLPIANTFGAAPSQGKLSISYAAEYCDNNDELVDDENPATKEVLVRVVQCLSHYNEEHPFAPPYHMVKRDGSNEQIESEYLATHSCCNNGAWKTEDEPCFISPLPGCYSGSDDSRYQYSGVPRYTDDPHRKGYWLEKLTRKCTGTSGNKCEGAFEGELWEGRAVCGRDEMETKDDGTVLPKQEGCNNIASECQGLPAFSLIEGQGRCHGTMGCADFDDDPLVYVGKDSPPPRLSPATENQKIIDNKIFTDNQFKAEYDLEVGCAGHDGKPCDGNFDGSFDLVCSGGQCLEKICTVGDTRCGCPANNPDCS